MLVLDWTPIHLEPLILALFIRLRALYPPPLSVPSGCCEALGLSRVDAETADILLSISLLLSSSVSFFGAGTLSLKMQCKHVNNVGWFCYIVKRLVDAETIVCKIFWSICTLVKKHVVSEERYFFQIDLDFLQDEQTAS